MRLLMLTSNILHQRRLSSWDLDCACCSDTMLIWYSKVQFKMHLFLKLPAQGSNKLSSSWLNVCLSLEVRSQLQSRQLTQCTLSSLIKIFMLDSRFSRTNSSLWLSRWVRPSRSRFSLNSTQILSSNIKKKLQTRLLCSSQPWSIESSWKSRTVMPKEKKQILRSKSVGIAFRLCA